MTDPPALLARLEQLETRVSFQDQAIEELSTTVTDNWKLIEGLRRELARLTDQVKDVENALDAVPSKEPPPPHY